MLVVHHLTPIDRLPRAIGSKIYIFHSVYKRMHESEWYTVIC